MSETLPFIFFIIFVSIAIAYTLKKDAEAAKKDAQKAEIERAK